MARIQGDRTRFPGKARKEIIMTKTIEITSKSQVERINQLASEVPYEV